MDSIPNALKVEFTLDPEPFDKPQQDWQYWLWISGELRLSVHSELYFCSSNFGLVELATQYCRWRSVALATQTSFHYDSLDSDEIILAFEVHDDWVFIRTPLATLREPASIPLSSFTSALDDYVEKLELAVRSAYGIEIGTVLRPSET